MIDDVVPALPVMPCQAFDPRQPGGTPRECPDGGGAGDPTLVSTPATVAGDERECRLRRLIGMRRGDVVRIARQYQQFGIRNPLLPGTGFLDGAKPALL